MLLQRASAGSGKTFKLAKTYIRLFISHKEEGQDFYRLLRPEEVRDSHSHILGVTFTNKATNEMKQRIVEKLASLAQAVPEKGMEPAGYRFPDYMQDFTGETAGADPVEDVIYNTEGKPASRHEITLTCRAALNVLLNDYGRFNISTIDSFFQGVLRTLAYELRLNDTYHVELNDDYLAQVGVDESLSSVKETGRGPKAEMGEYMRGWLHTMMLRRLNAGDAWDPFAKNSRNGIYGELLALARFMNRESFKEKMRELEEYFSSPERFRIFYAGVLEASAEVGRLRLETLEAVARFEDAKYASDYASGVDSGLVAIKMAKDFGKPKTGVKFEKWKSSYEGERDSRSNPFKAKTNASTNPQAYELFTEVCDRLEAWQEAASYWRHILSRLHYMGTLFYIGRNIDDFREENNIIPLSATNDILHQIIGKDEVPFIYERTGVHLHHYLLDEFQDTSRMQWENLKPLLEESESHGYGNLIIGDAKQSIYRFRSADPSLITSKVEADIPSTRCVPNQKEAGTPAYNAVNTNWRSSRHVVEFNNSIFKTASSLMDTPGGTAIRDLYANVVQNVRHTGTPGYVRIDFNKPDDYYAGLGVRIDDLRQRGFALSEIAILVNNNSEGQEVIRSLMRHNAAMCSNTEYEPIEIISEESLKINESCAVKVILSVMALMARDFVLPEHEEGKPVSKQLRLYELERLVANYRIGLSRGDVKGLADIAGAEDKSAISQADIESLYRRMGAVTLPSMVECIAAEMLTEEMRKAEVAYICGFQDAVLEYCEAYPADLNSFLSWWEENGSARSIAAPEEADAIHVMTIHKSKGLEFEAVILPKADWEAGPEREEREIIWVKHTPRGLSENAAANAPESLPVTPCKADMNHVESPFYKEYNEYYMECRTDQLNKTYVAFTRAVKELYVTAPVSKKDTVSNYLRESINMLINTPAESANEINSAECVMDSDVFEYGTPTIRKREPRKEENRETLMIETYCPKHPVTYSNAKIYLETNN